MGGPKWRTLSAWDHDRIRFRLTGARLVESNACLSTPGGDLVSLSEQAAILALTQAASAAKVHWYEVADLVENVGSATALATGTLSFPEVRDTTLAKALLEHISDEVIETWHTSLTRLIDRDIWLITVLDEEYPTNLRRVYNRPPFLFVHGSLQEADERSVAVVGTRRPSPDGRMQVRQLAAELARRGVTVVSGLAAGIDAEGHRAALDAGGRTVAVMGTGIDRVYPAENKELAMRIPAQGALVSQFWPGAPPRAENFPLRNVVSSGIAMGTVVVEANGKSGARMQARLALEHGKRLLLVEPLVLQEQWARDYAKRPGAIVVKSVDDVIQVLEAEELVQRAEQLSIF